MVWIEFIDSSSCAINSRFNVTESGSECVRSVVKTSVNVHFSLSVLKRLSQQCSSDVDVSEVMSDESVLIADETMRRRCGVQRTVVTWVHRNIIDVAPTAWLESFCQWGRVVVVVHCSAVECDDCPSQRPTRDLHCPVISDEATWRQWMFSVDDQWRLLHSPTHTHTHTHTHRETVRYVAVANISHRQATNNIR